MKWRLEREWPALAALAVLYLFLAVAAPSFYHLENLRDLALANVSVLLVAAGMTLIIVIGQIDISVGSLFAVTSVACGVLVKAGLPLILAPLAAILIGAALGAINGGLISFVRAPSIVVNLEEAKGALTQPDTLHKTGIARREARETLRWLLLIRDAELLPAARLEPLIVEGDQLVAMLTAGTKRLQERIRRDKKH